MLIRITSTYNILVELEDLLLNLNYFCSTCSRFIFWSNQSQRTENAEKSNKKRKRYSKEIRKDVDQIRYMIEKGGEEAEEGGRGRCMNQEMKSGNTFAYRVG